MQNDAFKVMYIDQKQVYNKYNVLLKEINNKFELEPVSDNMDVDIYFKVEERSFTERITLIFSRNYQYFKK